MIITLTRNRIGILLCIMLVVTVSLLLFIVGKPYWTAVIQELPVVRSTSLASYGLTLKEYLNLVQHRIKNAWKPSMYRYDTRMVVGFALNPDGTVKETRIIGSSGNKELDQSALQAIHHAAPFPPVPPSVGDEPVKIEMEFEYNVVHTP